MKIATLYRSDLVLNISMAGTITHAGCILVAALPPTLRYPLLTSGANRELINSLLTSPHAFLHANEATSVNLTIPWYCNTDLATLTMDSIESTIDLNGTKGNYATLVFMVLNPLAPSTGSSTSLSIIIEACFKNLDILVPSPRYVQWTAQTKECKKDEIPSLVTMTKSGLKTVANDFIDYGVGALASMVGLHNPNQAGINDRMIMTQRNFHNIVDGQQFFEKLDPNMNFNRITSEPTFGTSVDEMSISHIASKRQFLGSFNVSINDSVGKLYWTRPISPYQGGMYVPTTEAGNNFFSNNLELLHTLHRAWRGDLKIIVQAVMNNKQQCKLKLIKMYNPPGNALTASPVYQTIANAPSHLMEFTQGGQEHEIVLPFLARNEVLPCSEDQNVEAFLHGLYYIYLAQPLANSDGSPTTITFNVFMAGEPNLSFYGYSTRSIENILPFFPDVNLPPTTFQAQSGDGDPIRVMNEPQKQDNKADADYKERALDHMDRLMPNFDVRPLVRRMYLQKFKTFSLPQATTTTLMIPLNLFVGEASFPSRTSSEIPNTPTVAISNMYYSKNVGFKVFLEISRLSNSTTTAPLQNVDVKIFYIPPSLTFDSSTMTACYSFPNSAMNNSSTVTPMYCQLPYQITPVQEQVNSLAYEFVVPNVTFYKYMGSPNKYHGGSGKIPLTTSDFGTIAVYITNNHSTDAMTIKLDQSIGLTDESRFGHHAIAPMFTIKKSSSPFLDTLAAPFSQIKNSNIYKGSFL